MYSIQLTVEELDNGEFLGTTDDLPGLVAQGRTINETIEIAQDVARKLLESYIEHNEPLPPGLKTIKQKAKLDLAIGL